MAFFRNTYSIEERDAYIAGAEALAEMLKQKDGIDQATVDLCVSFARNRAHSRTVNGGRMTEDEEEQLEQVQFNLKKARALLGRYINKRMVDEIERSYVEYAMVCAKQLKFNRIYTAVGMTCRDLLKFGPKKTLKFLHYFDDICGKIGDNEDTWTNQMNNLLEEMGLVVMSGNIDLPKHLREFDPDVELREENETR